MQSLNNIKNKTKEELLKYIEKLEERNQFLEEFYETGSNIKSAIAERVKELSCMYEIAKILTVEDDIDKVFSLIVKCIPNGWQFPEATVARIRVNDKTVQSDNFKETEWFQKENIIVDSEKVGIIEIFYISVKPEIQNNPFLKEERDLIRGIANLLGMKMKQDQIKETKKIINQQLLHADRLATIGKLAAGVAHELNEPLANILGFTQLSLRNKDLPESIYEDLKKIETASFHARGITKNLLEFSKQYPANIKEIDFSNTINDSIYFLESRCEKKGIKLTKNYTENIILNADPGQIKQIVTNLVINATQATENSGEIFIETTSNNDYAILKVSDTGCGIPLQHLDKIFVPFFSTKDIGEGTGLGLSVVYGIIKSQGGDIKVTSKEGKGTKFKVLFPIRNEEVNERE